MDEPDDAEQRFYAALAVYSDLCALAQKAGLDPADLYMVAAIAVASVTLDERDIKPCCDKIADASLKLHKILGDRRLRQRLWS